MTKSLEMFRKQKRYFDINNAEDIEVYKNFLDYNNSWGSDTCPFILEFPYLTVPDMIKDKLIYHFLGLEQPHY
jgi:hypothetical protein